MPKDDLGSSLLAHLDWRGLLERWSREAVAHAEELRLDLTPDVRATGWIGRPPASAATLEAAERRLGHALPPSLRAFAAVTDGWPVLSMDYGELRRVDQLGWVVDLEPELVEIWGGGDDEPENDELEDDDEFEDDELEDTDAALLRRALLLSTGTDHFLLDPRHAGPAGEWASCDFTSWYPGVGGSGSSFRAGLERHYASFVCFTATDSVTRVEVADQVERAYRSSLRGDRASE